jgi:hypothetical protein
MLTLAPTHDYDADKALLDLLGLQPRVPFKDAGSPVLTG